jgi:hypothetical protein
VGDLIGELLEAGSHAVGATVLEGIQELAGTFERLSGAVGVTCGE